MRTTSSPASICSRYWRYRQALQHLEQSCTDPCRWSLIQERDARVRALRLYRSTSGYSRLHSQPAVCQCVLPLRNVARSIADSPALRSLLYHNDLCFERKHGFQLYSLLIHFSRRIKAVHADTKSQHASPPFRSINSRSAIGCMDNGYRNIILPSCFTNAVNRSYCSFVYSLSVSSARA